MPIDKRVVRAHFNLHARNYDEHNVLQQLVADNLAALIEDGRGRSKVLEIGCGTGSFTRLLAAKFPDGIITALDIAEHMIGEAKARLSRNGTILFVQADGEHMPFRGPFDYIVSSTTFQWFNDLEKSLRDFTALLRPGGKLVFSVFIDGTFHELFACFDECAREDGRTFPRPAQALLTPDQIRSILEQARFSVYAFSEREEQVAFRSFRDFHDNIKRIGASNANTSRPRIPKSVVLKLAQRYTEQYRNRTNEVTATYKVACFSCEHLGMAGLSR